MAPILVIITFAIFGFIAVPVVANIEDIEAPTPNPTETPTPTPTISPTSSPTKSPTTTIDYSGTGDFEETKGNSHVKIESNGGTNTVHVESEGNSSSEVNIKTNSF